MMIRAPAILILIGTLVACGGASDPDPTSPVGGGAPALAKSTCFWAGPYVQENPETNFGLLDTAALYWSANFVLPEGAQIEIGGDYAHGRYLSFNAYNADGEATDALNDSRIVAEPGAVNPFLPGADRLATARGYRLLAVPDAPPAEVAQRSPNTLYLSRAEDGHVQMLYRLYVPDQDQGDTGGVPLPSVTLLPAGGEPLAGEAACTALQSKGEVMPSSTTVLPESTYALLREQAFRAEGFPALDPPQWFKFFNSTAFGLCAYLQFCGGQPEANGGIYNNLDNSYVYSFVSRVFGPVVLLRGKLPLTPHTASGEALAEAGELRYWSICSYEAYTQRVEPQGCLYDEQLPLDEERRYTIVLSSPQDRPANARPECGYAWLEWSPNGDGFGNLEDGQLLLRNLLAATEFPHSVQKVETPGSEAAVMGEYLPSIEYRDRAGVEALGCGGS